MMRAAPVVVAVVGLVLVACSDGGQTPAATRSTAPPSSTATATWPSPPTVIDYSGAKLVTGREDFEVNTGTATFDADGTGHDRGGTIRSTITCADPRVAGTAVGTWNSDRWGSSLDNGALVQWGEYTITNAGGSWTGSLTGIATTATSDVITWWLTGTGKYAGLSMYMWEIPALTPDTGEGAVFTALIFPGKPPRP